MSSKQNDKYIMTFNSARDQRDDTQLESHHISLIKELENTHTKNLLNNIYHEYPTQEPRGKAKYLRKNKVNVMGHLGILPQSHKGKFRYKGKTKLERKNLLADALLLQKNGVFSIVLECIETNLAKEITNKLKIPTIGIGSSVNCDGQVLVTDDLIGLNLTSIKFVKTFYNIRLNCPITSTSIKNP